MHERNVLGGEREAHSTALGVVQRGVEGPPGRELGDKPKSERRKCIGFKPMKLAQK
jgi:hypothetical protein